MSKRETDQRTAAKTVLLAEQDGSVRGLLEDIVRAEGFKPLLADSQERCMFLALQRSIDAFVLDLNLPGGDPVALCARLRDIDRYRQSPILLTTAEPDSQSEASTLEAGADDILEKPINPVIATARLKGHLHRVTMLRESERVRANLNRYISSRTKQMVERCASTESSPEPEEREVCVMFSDVRGFTSMSQDMSPNALFRLLGRHLAMQVNSVYRRGGYVDKFGGDGIMAIFDENDAAMAACHCALEIMESTRFGGAHDGPPVLPLGVGLNMGSVLIGNIGSDEHLDYTAIGETVNLAARLCGSAAPMSIVVSDTVVSAARSDNGLDFVDRRSVTVRGIDDPVAVYSLAPSRVPRARTRQPGYAVAKFDRRGM